MNSSRPSTAKRKERIWTSLLSLLEEKPLDEVTVEDICQRADIHRTTFYNHFNDIYDLISYGTRTILPDMLPNESGYPAAEVITEYLLKFMIEHRLVITNLLRTSYERELFNATDKVVEEYFLSLVKSQGGTEDIEPELCVRFYCAGLVYMLLRWTERLPQEEKTIRKEAGQIISLILH